MVLLLAQTARVPPRPPLIKRLVIQIVLLGLIVAAGGIEALVELVRNDDGAVGGKELAAWTLSDLAYDNAANQVAIVAAGAVDPLIDFVIHDLAGAGQAALWVLDELDLPSIASRVQILQAENERLRARVEELEERHERPRRRDRMEAAQ